MKNKPTVTHIKYFAGGEWKAKTFLPLFDDQLVWCEDVKNVFCSNCPLANCAHPMVPDEQNHNVLHKLCTLSVLKLGLISLKEIDDTIWEKSDRQHVKDLLAKLVKVPTKRKLDC